MELLTSKPFGELSADSARKLKLSPQVRQLLPDAELKVEIGGNDHAGGAGSKRVALQIRWHNRSGEWDAPVRLVSWIYRGGPVQ